MALRKSSPSSRRCCAVASMLGSKKCHVPRPSRLADSARSAFLISCIGWELSLGASEIPMLTPIAEMMAFDVAGLADTVDDPARQAFDL